MLGADPDVFFGHFLDAWTTVPVAIPAEVRERYLAACRRPETIHAICEDYRASATVDLDHDRVDQGVGCTVRAPTLALWREPGARHLPFDPSEVWARWTRTLTTAAVESGHSGRRPRPSRTAHGSHGP